MLTCFLLQRSTSKCTPFIYSINSTTPQSLVTMKDSRSDTSFGSLPYKRYAWVDFLDALFTAVLFGLNCFVGTSFEGFDNLFFWTNSWDTTSSRVLGISPCPLSDTPLIDHFATVMRESPWADCLAAAPYTREFVAESPVLERVPEQFADSEQSPLRNDIFFGSSFSCKLRVFEEDSPFVD